MELKLWLKSTSTFAITLLIVPYGIETPAASIHLHIFQCLLIVPYGIETSKGWVCPLMTRLLIVPYGIETRLSVTGLSLRGAFNRTLWN